MKISTRRQRLVAQASPPAGSRTVSVQQSGAGERGPAVARTASTHALPHAPNSSNAERPPAWHSEFDVRCSMSCRAEAVRRRIDVPSLDPRPSTPGPFSPGFTIIEIALCLGIIAFALVAIIGALPTGLNVQKNNREQTIISEDAQVWMNTLRSGAQGFDDLTNYVVCITNFWTTYTYSGITPSTTPLYGYGGGTSNKSGVDWYTLTNSNVPGFFMTNGAAIVGILSTPTWTPVFNRSFHTPPPTSKYQSNYIVAYFRSMSGSEVDKTPQNNATVLQDAFTYRMIVQNFPYAAVDTNGFCLDCIATNALTTSNQFALRTNAAYSQWLLETNTHDFRLLFRWPVLPNGQIPNYGRYTFRNMVNGQLSVSNFPNPPNNSPLFYVQPSVYAEITTNQPTRPSPQ